jgi:hypothetical protein
VRRARLVARLAGLSLLLACASRAGEILPFLAEGRVGAHLRDLALPATLDKDLTSGLTSRFLARAQLQAGTHTLAQSAVEITVKYDLWDENFRVVMSVDEHAVLDTMYPHLADVRAFLQDMRVPGMFAVSGAPPGELLTVQASVLLNPVDRERMNRLREWVKQNSTPAPSDPTSPDAAAPVRAAPANALFDRIFAQYAGDKDLAAAWHEALISRPFSIAGLAHEGR